MVARVLVVPVSGHVSIVEVDPTLETFQELVGGYIEGITLSGNVLVYVNEDGVSKGLPPNERLTRAIGSMVETVLVGDAVITGVNEDGEPRSLSEAEALGWAAMLTREHLDA